MARNYKWRLLLVTGLLNIFSFTANAINDLG